MSRAKKTSDFMIETSEGNKISAHKTRWIVTCGSNTWIFIIDVGGYKLQYKQLRSMLVIKAKVGNMSFFLMILIEIKEVLKFILSLKHSLTVFISLKIH